MPRSAGTCEPPTAAAAPAADTTASIALPMAVPTISPTAAPRAAPPSVFGGCGRASSPAAPLAVALSSGAV